APQRILAIAPAQEPDADQVSARVVPFQSSAGGAVGPAGSVARSLSWSLRRAGPLPNRLSAERTAPFASSTSTTITITSLHAGLQKRYRASAHATPPAATRMA